MLARLRAHAMASSALKIKSWPFPARIALRERAQTGRASRARSPGPISVRRATRSNWRRSFAFDAGASAPRSMPMCTRILLRFFLQSRRARLAGTARADTAPLERQRLVIGSRPAPEGPASALARNSAVFGAEDLRERSHDVKFQGTLEVGYRACLWSRSATRVLLSLGQIDARSGTALRGAKHIDWRAALCAGCDARLRLAAAATRRSGTRSTVRSC